MHIVELRFWFSHGWHSKDESRDIKSKIINISTKIYASSELI